MTTPVRRLPGPFATRVCTPVSGGFAWREELSGGLTGLLDALQLEALREVVPQEPCPAVVPVVTGDIAVSATVPTSQLAFDVVFSAQGPPDDAKMVFQRLGRYLARLHRSAIPPALAELPSGSGQRVQPADARMREACDAARGWLAGQAGIPTDPPAVTGDTVLTHGRFSLGLLAWASRPTMRPTILGWREAGPGPALSDMDTLLGELAEAAALGQRPPEQFSELAVAFVDGYRADGTLIPGWAAGLADRLAAHVLDHMALRAAVTSDRLAPLAFLKLVRDRLPEFCGSIAAMAPEAVT